MKHDFPATSLTSLIDHDSTAFARTSGDTTCRTARIAGKAWKDRPVCTRPMLASAVAAGVHMPLRARWPGHRRARDIHVYPRRNSHSWRHRHRRSRHRNAWHILGPSGRTNRRVSIGFVLSWNDLRSSCASARVINCVLDLFRVWLRCSQSVWRGRLQRVRRSELYGLNRLNALRCGWVRIRFGIGRSRIFLC